MGHTVLVCDDAIFMRTMISDILAQAGYEVIGEAESGAQAVQRYRELKPDLVTMDIVMPDMSGRDLLEAIMLELPRLKCLFMSGYTADVIADRGILNEGVNFIEKPFSVQGLAEKVREVLSAD